jgi:membrane-associated phospholipid phosphatase
MDRARPATRVPVADPTKFPATTWWVLTGPAFVVLALLARRVPYFTLDLAISRAVQHAQLGPLRWVLDLLNASGFPPVVDILDGVVLLAIFIAGLRWDAVVATFSALGAAGANYGVKLLVPRDRPPDTLIHVAHHIHHSAFPAGHVSSITAFLGFLSFVALARMAPSWRRTALIALMVSAIALMGPARILAGEHWPSDVLGGYLLGATWLAVPISLYEWGRRRGFDRWGRR